MGQRFFFLSYNQEEMKTDKRKTKNNNHSEKNPCSSVVHSPGGVGGGNSPFHLGGRGGVASSLSPIGHCQSHLNHA